MKISSFVSCALLASLSASAFAIKIDMKPGLWEQTFKLNEASANTVQTAQTVMDNMKKHLAELPPAQREMVEQMMSQNGLDTSFADAIPAEEKQKMLKDGAVVKQCITQADIDRGQLPELEQSCASNITQVSTSVFKLAYVCNGDVSGRGESVVTFQNPKAYTGDVSFTLGEVASIAELQGSVVGKWLSSNCGDVKPEPTPTSQKSKI